MDKNKARKIARDFFANLKEQDLIKRKQEIIKFLKINPQFITAKKVGIYYPLIGEIDLTSLLVLYPEKQFYFPKTENKDLTFREVNDLKELQLGKFGLKEPTLLHKKEQFIDLYLVPCVATTKNYRIGHGAGYYDRYFKNHFGYKIGIVHQAMKNLDVDVEVHDIAMDEIL